MLEGKAVVSETDMPELMQSHVMELAYQALDLHEVSDCQSIAHYIKQVCSEAHGSLNQPALNFLLSERIPCQLQ